VLGCARAEFIHAQPPRERGQLDLLRGETKRARLEHRRIELRRVTQG
jgi:hypothetical protein